MRKRMPEAACRTKNLIKGKAIFKTCIARIDVPIDQAPQENS
jgi:hypothetical protein